VRREVTRRGARAPSRARAAGHSVVVIGKLAERTKQDDVPELRLPRGDVALDRWDAIRRAWTG
jgi:hypothetical protein